MTGALEILEIGPSVTVQDMGRPGHVARGLSRGGAADVLALHEAQVLLGASMPVAALEMAGLGGRFRITRAGRIALTGAPMRASINDAAVEWSAVHAVSAGDVIQIGPVTKGAYGYLSVGGGFAMPDVFGSQSAHLVAGIGGLLQAGETLPLAEDTGGPVGYRLSIDDRFSGGTARIVASAQTSFFSAGDLETLFATTFTKGARGNRQGVSLQGGAFAAAQGLTIVSETIAPGDIQVAGDGTPYILLAECQTTGGYPRIATVIKTDLPLMAQTPSGADVRLEMITREAAVDAMRAEAKMIKALAQRLDPMVTPPTTDSLFAHSLISGVLTGWDE